MSTTLERVQNRPHVAIVDDERDLGNSIIVTLKDDYFFVADPGSGVRGFDTATEAEQGTRATAVYQGKRDAH